jgi:hypothetical protein
VVRLAPGVPLPGPAQTDAHVEEDGSVDRAHADFLRLGSGIEVLDPPELRDRIARTATGLAERYGHRARPVTAGPDRGARSGRSRR